MRAWWMALALAMASVFAVACSDDKPSGKLDMASGGICPNNPQFCAGTCCGTTCVQTDVDKNNCGGCNIACGAGAVCAKSKCACLPAGTGDTQTDVHNCGSCGHDCGAGATCTAGKCVCGGASARATDVCCNGMCSVTCVLPDMSSGLPPCDCSGLVDIFGSSARSRTPASRRTAASRTRRATRCSRCAPRRRPCARSRRCKDQHRA